MLKSVHGAAPCRAAAVSAALLMLGLLGHVAAAEQAQKAETRLVLLGTAGGPSAKKTRAQPANAVIINDAVYAVDAGDGVVRQMELADISPRRLRAVFLTHHHSDHNAGYCSLLLRAWASGLRTNVDIHGPPPLNQITRSCLEMNAWDIDLRKVDEGRPDLAALIKVHEIGGDGVIHQDENVKVTAFEVPHGAAKPSYGFRFDTPDGSIVFSGDTSGGENLIEHAKGATVLVHEVVSVPGVDALVERIDPGNEELKRHIIEAHTPPDEVGRIAAEAGVDTLVLTHFVPTDGPADQAELWREGAQEGFDGEIIVGEDLMELHP
jgi:ribonuclease BN (tRNA processing enzyme)